MYLIVLGVALLVVVATQIVKRVEWSTKTKTLLAVIVSTIAAGLLAWLGGPELFDVENLDAEAFLVLVTSIYGSAQAVYTFILQGTKFDAVGVAVNVLPAPAYEPQHAALDETDTEQLG